jgi:hypothetical protein
VFLSDGTRFVGAGSWTGEGRGVDPWYIGDFNGDGMDDIFRYWPGVSGADLFLSDGMRFVYSGSWTGAGRGVDDWYIGDFNGDGMDDIFRYWPGISGADVFLSDGTKFVYSGSWTGAGYGTDGWYVRDFNGDGRDDIMRYVAGVSGAQVFLSDGTHFVHAGSWTGAGHGADGWYLGDFDGNGMQDIFRYRPGVSGAEVFVVSCADGMTSAISIESISVYDGDMLLDVSGVKKTEMSYQEEFEFLAPFMERVVMAEEVSIYEIKQAYEEIVEHVVRITTIRQLLNRHNYWDLMERFPQLHNTEKKIKQK